MDINPNSLDNKGSCWILKDFYCSVTMLRELGLSDRRYTCLDRPPTVRDVQCSRTQIWSKLYKTIPCLCPQHIN